MPTDPGEDKDKDAVPGDWTSALGPPDQPEEKSGGNAGAIAAGVLVPLIVIAIAGLFIQRRRSSRGRPRKLRSKKSRDYAGDLAGGPLGSDRSSRDEFSSGDSDSSGSMKSYSSHSSSDSSEDRSTNYSSSSYSATTSQSGSTATADQSAASGGAEARAKEAQRAVEASNAAATPLASPLASPYAMPATDDGNSRSSRDGSSVQSGPDDGYGPGYVGSKYGESPVSPGGLGAIPESPASESGSSRGSSRSRGTGRSSARDHSTDDSSAGSSGWESGDGDSSIDSADVSSFDGDLDSAGNTVSTSGEGGTGDTMTSEEVMAIVNPAVNPVVQRG